MRGVSERTVQRDWEKARIYLHHVLRTAAAGVMSRFDGVSDLLIESAMGAWTAPLAAASSRLDRCST